jgi:hypothetical protein
MATKIKKIVNIRLRPDQEERINAIVERSAILDTSKFVRIAVDWLLRSDIGEVIKTIVHDERRHVRVGHEPAFDKIELLGAHCGFTDAG